MPKYDGVNHKLLAQDILYQMFNKKNDVAYWVFQGNPKVYKIEDAFKNDAIKTWSIKSHKKDIKAGDKFILWVTGTSAGCYALGEVTSDVYSGTDDEGELKYYFQKQGNTVSDRVEINITHNFFDNPILKKEIDTIKGLKKLNVGNQGTNFTATKEQYDKMIMIRKDVKSGEIVSEHNSYESINKPETKVKIANMPLNQILYGPPGTGKTYQLQNKYFDLFTVTNETKTKDRFVSDLVRDLSWWEVIAIALLDTGTTKVPDLLSHELLKAKNKLSQNSKPGNTVWFYLQQHTALDSETVNIKERREPFIFSKTKGSEWSLRKEEFEQSCPDLKALYDSFINFKETSETKKNYEFVTFHQSFTYEDFIEGIKPVINESVEETGDVTYEIADGVFKKLAIEAAQNPNTNYAIFIDEINRGNMAKIFGELITLIEPDKRGELTVVLPYSKKEFSVPKNLFIIGTMNTADRSIALLDTALRRRFEFIEMMPESKLLGNRVVNGINLTSLLEKINERIEFLYDRDHTIGHSYLWEVETFDQLCDAFRNKIIPLLQEYFYNDWEKVQLVLGDNDKWKNDDEHRLIQLYKTYTSKEEKALFGDDVEDYEDVVRYQVNQHLKDKDYRNIPAKAFTNIYIKPDLIK